MPTTSNRLSSGAAVLVFLICLGFAACTHHAWEDYLITFRASLNLASGNGLVYQPSERVHSFTSPLGTLLPALFAFGDPSNVEIRALWFFRLISAIALSIAVLLAIREFSRSRLIPWTATLACGIWIFDPKIIDFSINGMESGLLIFFVVLTWWALVNHAKLWPTALGFAGLQWTRPDGFVFCGALALAWLYWNEKPAVAGKLKPWQTLAQAVALGILMYLPWVLFAWFYYGSPIPHTIVAKQFDHPLMETAASLVLYPLRLLVGHVAIHDIFMPAYYYFGGWPSGLTWFSRLIGTGAAITWLWPSVKPAGRVASTALFLGGFYLQYIPGSPWYFPGWQVLACISWAYLFDALAQPTRPSLLLLRIVRTSGLMFVVLQMTLLVAVAWQMRNQQTLIEDSHRREIGRWLHLHASPSDRVYLEPLGYIGFYSGLKMLDNPGLCSPEVVAIRKSGKTNHATIIAALNPEWLVLRPDQVQSVNESLPQLLSQHYELARIFDVRSQVNAVRFIPGRDYLDFDARFLVYVRNGAGLSHDRH